MKARLRLRSQGIARSYLRVILASAIAAVVTFTPPKETAAQLRSEIAQSIERFSQWKTNVETTVRNAKRILSTDELRGVQFLYTPVRADVNALVDRVSTDIELGNRLDEEDYRSSVTNAQRDIDQLMSFTTGAIWSREASNASQQLSFKKNVKKFVTFLGSILSIISVENELNHSERLLLVEKLRSLKLPPFNDISGSL